MPRAEQRFRAELRAGAGGGVYVEVPFDVREVFGAARVKVRASFDGQPYRGSIACMGGTYVLGVVKAIRTRIDKGVGDTVVVEVAVDEAPRLVELPEELEALLRAHPRARERYDALSYTRRRELAGHVQQARRAATRERRAAQALDELLRA